MEVHTYYVHPDHLGTPQQLTDRHQQIVWEAVYEPFGQTTLHTERVFQPLRFPGQYADPETGLHQNWHRDYDPDIGRYLQSDPIGLRGGLSTFGYVGQDPLGGIDPTGLVKLYGAWCGPDCTGGFRKSYDQLDPTERKAALSPIDDLDTCCQSHDIAYATCRERHPCDPEARSQCFKEADRRLSSCSSATSNDKSPMALLFGDPRSRIKNYMMDSEPSPGPNDSSCGCEK